MPRRRSDDLEAAIEDALAPGTFVGYRDNGDFVDGVAAVRARIVSLVQKNEAARAVGLLETLIAGCYEKAEEIDDSDGSFGQFVGGLFCDWIKARQASKADPNETAAMLLSWMENDDYGYCNDLAKPAIQALDREGRVALARAAAGNLSTDEKQRDARHTRVEVLKAIHETRRDASAYAALCEAEGGLSPRDCERLAEMCVKRRRLDDALGWVGRGLEQEAKRHWPNESAWRLPELKRELLKKLGRSGDALASAWEDYRRAPSTFSYDDLMKFAPRAERAAWHAKAMDALADAPLQSAIEILVETKERERLGRLVEAASRADLMTLSHYLAEPAAKSLAKAQPLLAANLQVAMALRILEAKKSKYYHVALDRLGEARRVLTREGRDEEWKALAAEIRQRHRLKLGFMAAFARLGEKPSSEPSFLDRARGRWIRRARTHRHARRP